MQKRWDNFSSLKCLLFWLNLPHRESYLGPSNNNHQIPLWNWTHTVTANSRNTKIERSIVNIVAVLNKSLYLLLKKSLHRIGIILFLCMGGCVGSFLTTDRGVNVLSSGGCDFAANGNTVSERGSYFGHKSTWIVIKAPGQIISRH